MPPKLATALLATFFWLNSYAETFVVTSTANAGPGTLREAITLANGNGTATVDYIHFNIPLHSFVARIINLEEELPALSSNIVIDGTTQPGESYAVTEAKICLKKNAYAASFSLLKIDRAENVKIYGLYLYYGYWQGFFVPPFRSSDLHGIQLINSRNIEIGSPGKGNVMTGVVNGIFSDSDSCRGVSIRANYFGHAGYYYNSNPALDVDPTIIRSECGITFKNVKDVTIGGDAQEDGNIFGGNNRAINISSRYPEKNGFVRIRHNWIARDYDKLKIIAGSFTHPYVLIGHDNYSYESDFRAEITDNDIAASVRLASISDSILIYRNHFEDDQVRPVSIRPKLSISRCSKGGKIGNDDPANANTFKWKKEGTYEQAIVLHFTGPVSYLKNEFECNSVHASPVWVYHGLPSLFAQVDSTASDLVRGRATPNARVDLYYDDECTACEGKAFIANVVASATGNWSYNGPITGTVVATATTTTGFTSEFSKPVFDQTRCQITHPTCGQNNGSIKGITTEGAETYFWINHTTGDTVSRSIDLTDVGPGYYFLYAVHGGTCINAGPNIVLEDLTPRIVLTNMRIQHPACGLFNGSVTGLTVSGAAASAYKWIDQLGQTVGTALNISNLGPGTYRFVITDQTPGGGCSDTATVTLINQSGPSLDISGAVITPASCGQSNGRINGITSFNVTGTPYIRWVNMQNQVVGNSLDLTGVPPGNYILKFKDQAACDTIRTTVFIVPDNGAIDIDETNKQISPAKCVGAGGSISGLRVTGADSYEWMALPANTTVGSASNITNLPHGNYQLVVRNSFGCSKTSSIFTVPQASFLPIAVSSATVQPALCGRDIGQVTVTAFSNPDSHYSFYWLNASSEEISNQVSLSGLRDGTYRLFARDSNGCEQQIYSAVIERLAPPVIAEAQLRITHDQCNEKKGSISQLAINGAVGPTSFEWVNSAGMTVGNDLSLTNVSAGTYMLQVTDAGVCKINAGPYVVSNDNEALPAPRYSDLIIQRHTDAVLQLQNPAQGSYSLFSDAGSTTPLAQSSNGQFVLPAVPDNRTVYIRRNTGTCSSAAVPVTIRVVDKSFFAIPTGFTPNGDGLNDRLPVRVIGYIELENFRIYNRWGVPVFETRALNAEWDGRFKGVLQPGDVYVWIAQGKDITGNSISEKGTVVLIR